MTRSPSNGGTAGRAVTADTREKLSDLAGAGLSREELVEALRKLVDALEPERWLRKSDAASACNVSLESVRGRCNRKTDPLPTLWRDGRDLVDVHALRLELAARPTRTNASRERAAATP